MLFRQGDIFHCPAFPPFLRAQANAPTSFLPKVRLQVIGTASTTALARADLYEHNGELFLDVLTDEAAVIHDEHDNDRADAWFVSRLATSRIRPQRSRQSTIRLRLIAILPCSAGSGGSLTGHLIKLVRAFVQAKMPRRMRVDGPLALARSRTLRHLPQMLSATTVDVRDCPRLIDLPESLTCDELLMDRVNVEKMPANVRVSRQVQRSRVPQAQSRRTARARSARSDWLHSAAPLTRRSDRP